jgi:hypothetical protein
MCIGLDLNDLFFWGGGINRTYRCPVQKDDDVDHVLHIFFGLYALICTYYHGYFMH